MKSRKLQALFIWIWILTLHNAYAQVLPNPSFESISQCPNSIGIVGLSDWIHGCYGGNTPDLFAACATDPRYGTPINEATSGISTGVLPHDGENYVHLRCCVPNESIRATFPQPLDLFKQYKISIWASLTVYNSFNVNTPFDLTATVQVRLPQTGNECENYLTIPMTGSFTTRGQWTLFEATFSVDNLMNTQLYPGAYVMDYPVNDPMNIVGVQQVFREQIEILAGGESILIDDMSIEEVPCSLDPTFNYDLICNNDANTVEIQFNTNATNLPGTFHQYNVYRMNGFSTADADIITYLGAVTGTPNSYTIPNTPGAFYMIKHGVWTRACEWVEQRQVFQVPTFNDPIDSDFTGSITSPAGFSTPVLSVSASSINPISRWGLFTSPIYYTNLGFWNLHTIITPGPVHQHTFTNIQNGQYYWVRHVSKNNCSDYQYTDKVFFVSSVKRNEDGEILDVSYDLVEEVEESISEEEYEIMMEEINAMEPVERIDLEASIVLHPNPSSDLVYISGGPVLTGAEIIITDDFGSVIHESVWSPEWLVNVSGWEPRLYFVKINTIEGSVTKKLYIE